MKKRKKINNNDLSTKGYLAIVQYIFRMTTIQLASKGLSINLDLETYPNLQDLKAVLQTLLPHEQNHFRFVLQYTDGDGKEKKLIQTQSDYEHYLKVRKHLENSDILQKRLKIVPLKTFAENAARLIASYKRKVGHKENEKCLVEFGKSSKQQKVDQFPQQNWVIENWLKWAHTNVQASKRGDFAYELDEMFSYQTVKTISYTIHEMSDDLLKEVQSYSHQVQRFEHSQNKLACILFSIYDNIAKQLGIDNSNMDNCLWKLTAWKNHKTQTKKKGSVKNFHITQSFQTLIPIIKPASTNWGLNCSKRKEKSVFTKGYLSAQELKERYHILDLIYYNSARLFKDEITQAQFFSATRTISDDDNSKFVSEVARAKTLYHNKYVNKPPSQPQDGILKPFEDIERVAILGDWGSGLPDSFDHIDQLVIVGGASVVLHLGDVYYAGFPNQFKVLSDKLAKLREKVPHLRYYTIPGNHDFYTNGGPFYDSLNLNNINPEDRQQFGFFCLRNKSNTVQYIGLDTGSSDSGTFNQINVVYEGPYIEKNELAWAIDKIKNFSGHSILLTHNQSFSPYDKILGSETRFGWYNPHVNAQLNQQFFDILPKLTVWYWGHEHRLNFFKPNVYGIPCSRTVGNSSFQVHHPNTYSVSFPYLDAVMPQFNPKMNDNQDPNKPYYDHTGCIATINTGKIQVNYIDFTSSYRLPSVRTRSFHQTLSKPVQQNLYTNRSYRIKDSSGLSWCINHSWVGTYIWLNYTPQDFTFQNSMNPNSYQVMVPYADYLIRNSGGQYLRLVHQSTLQWSNSITEQSHFRIEPMNYSTYLKTGQTFLISNLVTMKLRKVLTRNYYQMDPLRGYYWISTGSNETAKCQIYDPYQNNSVITL